MRLWNLGKKLAAWIKQWHRSSHGAFLEGAAWFGALVVLTFGLMALLGFFPLKHPPRMGPLPAAPSPTLIRVVEPVPAAPLLSFILVMGSGRTLIYEAVKGGIEVMGCGGVSYTNSEGILRRFGCGVTHLQSPQPLKLSERPVIETQTGAMFRP